MDELKNTLTGTLPETPTAFAPPKLQEIPTPKNFNKIGNTTKIHDANIRTLQETTRNESQMRDFQRIMSSASRQAYKDRQAQELGGIKNQFDPSKVSGGTFSSIIKGLEKGRGQDVSEIHNANIGTYRNVQDEINKRLEYLQKLREDKRQYMTDYEYGKKTDKKLVTGSKDATKRRKADKENYNRGYIQALQQAGSDTAYMDFTAAEIKQSIKSLADQNYAYEQIHGALLQEQIPVFPGSMAADYLGSIFK